VYAKRDQPICVSRNFVNKLLKLKAGEFQPEIAAKMSLGTRYFQAALRWINLVTRPISSTKNRTNEEAAQFGRFLCRQIMDLRSKGRCDQLGVVSWPTEFTPDSVFWLEHFYAIDEVPFNFCDDGKTVSVAGRDAAVRSLRGTEKRAGTAVLCCSATGELSTIVLIFKRKTAWSKKEAEF
jgi:hypothetical protein